MCSNIHHSEFSKFGSGPFEFLVLGAWRGKVGRGRVFHLPVTTVHIPSHYPRTSTAHPHKPGVSAHGFRDPGKPAWPEHFSHGDRMMLSQSQLLPSVYQCIQQGVHIHEVLKSWPAFLESQGMLGGCQPIMLPLLWAGNGWELALHRQTRRAQQ